MSGKSGKVNATEHKQGENREKKSRRRRKIRNYEYKETGRKRKFEDIGCPKKRSSVS